MRLSTLKLLRCPRKHCGAPLEVKVETRVETGIDPDLLYGSLGCARCQATFPVLDGVAIVHPEPSFVVKQQRQVISKHVDKSLLTPEEIGWLTPPPKLMDQGPGGPLENAIDYAQAAAFLTAKQEKWWGGSGPAADVLEKYWDDNPVTRIGEFLEKRPRVASFLDLGCGVGGTLRRLGKYCETGLGIDRAFSAVWTARAVMTGKMSELATAGDLLQGPAAKTTGIAPIPEWAAHCDFILGDVLHPPVETGSWAIVTGLGVIDVVADPLKFVEVHASLAAPGGLVIQGSPYHWRAAEAEVIRKRVPSSVDSSAAAASWLYAQQGLQTLEEQDDVPWMIFRYSRQIALYTYHFFVARRSPS